MMQLLAVAPIVFALAAAEQWTPVRCFPEGDDGPLSRLRGEELFVDEMEQLAGWRALHGGQNAGATLRVDTDDPHSGAGALAVHYQFQGKQDFEYVALARAFEIAEPGLGLVLWVKGDGTDLSLRVRVNDRSGETFQYNIASLGFTGWRRVGTLLRTAGGHWGGDGNGRVDYPCTFDSLLIDRPSRGYVGTGTLLLDRLALVREAEPKPAPFAVEALDRRVGNIYEPGEEIAIRVISQDEAADRLQWEVADYWDEVLATQSVAVEDEPVPLSWRSGALGWFRWKLRIVAGDEKLGEQEFRFGVLPPLDEMRPREPSAFGVCSHFCREHWPLEALQLVARARIAHIRDEMSWGSVEREKGTFRFPERYGEYVDAALSLGVEPLLILDYANSFYDGGNFPASQEAQEGFARYAREVATRFRGRLKYYEVWNEWSIGCGMRGKPKSTPEVYAGLLERTYRAVKKADPSATVVGIGGEHSKNHLDYIEGMLAAGAVDNMDAASVHSYRYPRGPDATDLLGELQNVEHVLRGHGGAQRIWLTEIGWPTHIGPRGVPERVQAQMLVKTYVLCLAAGCVDKVFWYDFKDDGLKREYNESNFGIVHHQEFNLAPKPAYVACAMLSRLLSAATFEQPLDFGEAARGLAFRAPGGNQINVLWTSDSPVRMHLKRGSRLVDMMGNESKPTGEVQLTADPVYVIGRPPEL
ncbi:MAG: hypothetical protein PVH68_11895 [Armatimonadota bacterium]|jgi:hypothetical protein